MFVNGTRVQTPTNIEIFMLYFLSMKMWPSQIEPSHRHLIWGPTDQIIYTDPREESAQTPNLNESLQDVHTKKCVGTNFNKKLEKGHTL